MLRPVRFTLASNKAALVGFSIALALVIAISFLFGGFFLEGASVGRVASLGLTEGKKGSRPIAVVEVDGVTALVRVPPNIDCRAGQQVALTQQRSILGPRYSVAIQPRPCFD